MSVEDLIAFVNVFVSLCVCCVFFAFCVLGVFVVFVCCCVFLLHVFLCYICGFFGGLFFSWCFFVSACYVCVLCSVSVRFICVL